MRPPQSAELTLLARVLMAHPAAARRAVAKKIIADTETAQIYLRHHGSAHPVYGDGSLIARLLPLSPMAEPFADDLDFLHSLSIAVERLLIHLEN